MQNICYGLGVAGPQRTIQIFACHRELQGFR